MKDLDNKQNSNIDDFLLSGGTKILPIVIFNSVGLALILSRIINPFYNLLWKSFDQSVFLALNGLLNSSNQSWLKFVAFANTKIYDKISALAIFLLMVIYIFYGKRSKFSKRSSVIFLIVLMMGLTVFLRKITGLLEFQEVKSPSFVIKPFVNLREMFPEIRPKIFESQSFPSDHALATFIFLSIFWFYAGWRWFIAGFILMPFFLLPRMIGGGHWISDTLAGGLALTMIIVPWLVCTPAFNTVGRFVNYYIEIIYSKIPAINKIEH